MKNKIIILFTLVILFVPAFSSALMPPYFNINIVKNTVGGDGIFDFNWHHNQYDHGSFQIETVDGSGAGSVTALVNGGDTVTISEDQQTGWQYTGAYCSSENQQVAYQITSNGVSITAYPFSSITCTLTNVKQNKKTPVLIVPGLLGTEMFNNSEKLWPDSTRMLTSIDDNFMDPLRFNEGLTPSNNDVAPEKVLNRELTFDYTEGLINEFKNQGYIEGTDANATLFTFPYDWRYGASGKFGDGTTNSYLLAQKIQAILQQTGADKVDVIAHSLGGLIVKKYIQEHQLDHHIRKTVFVGVPNTGAPKAVKVLLQGDNFNVLGLNDREIKKISENLPVSYDLLPDKQYYNQKGSFVKIIDEGEVGSLKEYIVKDLNYDEFKSFLISDHNLNSTGQSGAEILRTENFDNFDLRTAGVELFAIDGCKAATLGKIVERKYKNILGQSFIDYKRPELTPGDGTVPLESATNLPIDQNNKYYALISDHGKMPSQNGIRQEIVNLISGSNLNIENNLITQDIDKCELNGKAISVFSPVDIFVTDQNGNKLGLASDGSIINEIPNADFEVWGEHKFVFVPTDSGQAYSVNLTGTGNGTFTIKAEDINNNQIIKAEVFSNLLVTAELTGQVNLGATTTLSLNREPLPVLPSATLNAEQSGDLLPPISTATITDEQGQHGFYRHPVSVKIEATDENSGVLDVEYNLDNSGFQKIIGDSAIINISDEGKHTISFFSTDKAGNNEQEKTIIFTIDKTPPEAIIEFDPNIKDLKFTGADNVSEASLISISDKDDTIILTDQAGNATEIKLKRKNRKVLMRAEIKSIKYNGVSADINKNRMAFLWLYDKQKNLRMLSQIVQSKKDYNILAVYDGKNTKIIGKDSSGRISETVTGLKIIKIATNKGDFSWSY